ncbi:hypothetical protein KP509_37G053200 [Ceratopteris richardii]|uniref:DUF3741 domain-containing protein n=1 Tax=Ceratopteris richardii TaxID=49495 RepID=A0A8T2Q920_CERRI|nr:hypothetical protein KP509_37G053200 [Ceratopteris richardii]
MVRHNSFKDRDHDAITFSPRKGSVAAYVAGGRRFISEGSDYTAWNSCVDPLEDGLSNRTEEDKSAFFSSPASQWPSIDDTHGQAHELKGWKGAQLTYHGQVAEPHPATRESLEEWKESLRALSKLKKEVAAGGFSHRDGTLTPNVSYSAIRNELLPMSPARASAFDFKEVIRWSERSSFPESFARRSWDDRDLPRSIADLRNAINVRSRASTMASPPPSPRPPGVVARLMGLDNFPQEQSTLLKCIERKPSSEAKLLQQLLQCSPSPSCSPSPPNAAVKMQHQDNDVKCDMRSPFQSSPNSPDSDALRRPDSLRRPEFQSMLKRAELLGNDLNTSDIKTSMTFSKHPKPHKISAMAEPHPLQSVPLKRSRHRNHLPVVILKQSEENRSSSRSNSPYQDEIEKRLRQLGLQSSEQERKTLKQILEAMQQKGLLKPPSCSRFPDGAENQQAHSTRSPLSSKGNHSSVIPNVDKTAHIRSPDPQSLKNSMRQNSSMTCNKKQEGSASIVIMRPVGKLPSRIPAPTNGQLVESGRTMIPASTRLKKANVPRSKSGNRPETAPAKKSANGSRGRPRSLSNSSSSPSSMHTSVQGCKLSLKTRQSKGNKVKGSSQTVPIEQNWKKELDLSLQQSQMETSLQDGQNKFQAIGNIGKDKCPSEDAIYRDNLRDSDKKEMEHIPTQSACLLESLSVNMSSETSFMGSRMDVTTPPRELNGDSSFGDNHNYYAKEVDQCSPVSVLDVHLSDNDVSDSQVSDEEDHRKGLCF